MSIDEVKVTEIIKEAVKVLYDYLRGLKSTKEVLNEINNLRVNDLLRKYWNELIKNEKYADFLEALLIISSIARELEFQEKEYGLDSVKEDIESLAKLYLKIKGELQAL